MGRAVSFVNDRAVEVEREKLLDLKDHSDLSQNDRPGIRTEPFTPKRPSDFLPTLRDVINSVLFCGVTVFGITLISNAIPNIGWRNVRVFLFDLLTFILIATTEASSRSRQSQYHIYSHGHVPGEHSQHELEHGLHGP